MRVLVLLLIAGCSSGGGSSSPDLATSSSADLATASAGTWTSFAQQFFQTYCVSCHSPGQSAAQQDFNMYAAVKANMVNIRCGVAPAGMLPSGCSGTPPAGQFPIGSGPHPSDAERNAIIAWINAGAPM
jgi:hypothetical protein